MNTDGSTPASIPAALPVISQPARESSRNQDHLRQIIESSIRYLEEVALAFQVQIPENSKQLIHDIPLNSNDHREVTKRIDVLIRATSIRQGMRVAGIARTLRQALVDSQ